MTSRPTPWVFFSHTRSSCWITGKARFSNNSLRPPSSSILWVFGIRTWPFCCNCSTGLVSSHTIAKVREWFASPKQRKRSLPQCRDAVTARQILGHKKLRDLARLRDPNVSQGNEFALKYEIEQRFAKPGSQCELFNLPAPYVDATVENRSITVTHQPARQIRRRYRCKHLSVDSYWLFWLIHPADTVIRRRPHKRQSGESQMLSFLNRSPKSSMFGFKQQPRGTETSGDCSMESPSPRVSHLGAVSPLSKPRFFTGTSSLAEHSDEDNNNDHRTLLSPKTLSQKLSRFFSPASFAARKRELAPPSPVRRASRADSIVAIPPMFSSLSKGDFTKNAVTLRQILHHSTLGLELREYAAGCRADEGLRFLDEYASICRHNDINLVHENSAHFMREYFSITSPSSINLAAAVQQKLCDRFDSSQFRSVEDLFEDAALEVFSDFKQSDTFRKFCETNQDAKLFCNDASTLLLDSFVVPENFHLAIKSVCNDPELVNLIRFCCSVAEFERLPIKSTARRAQGRKILSMFFFNGAAFQLENMPAMYVDAMQREEFDFVLTDARVECLQLLSLDQALMETCRINST
ncbi:hypothetical protein BASA81_004853 [Batrachochytrium salamandrivorans]|nr:hypothetical protein BASA81_004853 [Batrachochytrium salamandrivorans]